jgi:hypothetical protein
VEVRLLELPHRELEEEEPSQEYRLLPKKDLE